MEAHGEVPGYMIARPVGGVDSAGVATEASLAAHPILINNHHRSGAGWQLVERLWQVTRVEATTTPGADSVLDRFLKVFGRDYKAAWKAVQALVAGQQRDGRAWSGTGREFLRGRRVVPAWLGAALLERETYRLAAGILWVYRDDVYRHIGANLARADTGRRHSSSGSPANQAR